MKKFCLIPLIIYTLFFDANGQNDVQISVDNTFMGANADHLPFWFWANHDGKINLSNSILNLTELGAGLQVQTKKNKNLHYRAGADIAGGLGKENYFQPNQLFAGLDLKGWSITGGLFCDSLRFDGLSTTNGNSVRSRNARPYPKIRLSTSEFKPVPLLGEYLSFSGEYDEGILNDDRYVAHTHLHHKSFYLRWEALESWKIQAGAEHFVMWGGTSANETVGEQPHDFSAYLTYISGSHGDERFNESDQLNVAGNQYGSYQVLISKEFRILTVSFNLSHQFEDFSGVNWNNWPDNLMGLDIKFKDTDKVITRFLYEYINTRHSGTRDGYMNNGIYRSGVTYNGMVLGQPLFLQGFNADGQSTGIKNNRFFSHHIGTKGRLSKNMIWESLLTYTQYWGAENGPTQSKNNQFSALLACNYTSKKLPVEIKFALASDYGEMRENNFGAQISVSKVW